MIPPDDELRQYNSLYHDFTRAYTDVRSLNRGFYPEALKFVEHTEPELARYVKKLHTRENDLDYQKLSIYLEHFDNFTLLVNKLLVDLKAAMDKSDRFMTRLFELRISTENKEGEDPNLLYIQLMPELSELVTGLKQIPQRAACLEMKMHKLENDWEKAKQQLR